MKLLVLSLLIFCSSVFANENGEIDISSYSDSFKDVANIYAQGKYQETIDELEVIRKDLKEKNIQDDKQFGLIAYWKGISFSRMQKFSRANKQFKKALRLNYSPLDINYEYGQSLYAMERYVSARTQFKLSLKKKFKRAVCLYYIGYISKELKERNNAVKFFQAVEKLPQAEGQEVLQAAEMQIGDVYLAQVERKAHVFRMVEEHVIPQYQKAYDINPESTLAPMIKEKIIGLQKKYDLVLFNLSNGRPTLVPPYFLRLASEYGLDSNVTYAPTETTVSKADQSSTYLKLETLGRYTFYAKKSFSFAPELRLNRTHYFHRTHDIYRNDNALIAPALRTAFEHTLWSKPASTLFDYEYNKGLKAVNERQTVDFSSETNTGMLGERFNLFNAGETIIRLKYRNLRSYLPDYNSYTKSIIFEQVKNFKENTLLMMFSYDQTRVRTSTLDTNSFTGRFDLVMSRVRDWFTPSFGVLMTSTDPINDRESRGKEFLFNPNVKASKTFFQKYRANFRIDYSNNNSKNKSQFAYEKTVYAFELEYIF